MEDKSPLFRQEAIDHRIHRNFGTTRINIPMVYHGTGYVALGLLFIILLFFCFAQLSDKTFVRGYLDSESSIISVQTEFSGIIDKAFVEEGKRVKKGELLYVVSNQEKDNANDLIDNLTQQTNNLNREYQLKKDHYLALLKLYKKHFIAASTVKDTESELLELNNKIKSANLELLKFKQSQSQFVKAPINGTITNIFYRQGQRIEPSKALLQIVPQHTKLVARLYVPSRDISFLNLGKKIKLKYDAYPSEKFGFYHATIKEVNLTILTDDKEDKPIQIGEPYYKIKAELNKPYLYFFGKNINLSHGMTLTAVIPGERKKIWQWIVEPIHSYYGDTFS